MISPRGVGVAVSTVNARCLFQRAHAFGIACRARRLRRCRGPARVRSGSSRVEEAEAALALPCLFLRSSVYPLVFSSSQTAPTVAVPVPEAAADLRPVASATAAAAFCTPARSRHAVPSPVTAYPFLSFPLSLVRYNAVPNAQDFRDDSSPAFNSSLGKTKRKKYSCSKEEKITNFGAICPMNTELLGKVIFRDYFASSLMKLALSVEQ